jgi:hypothetical protein
MSLRRERDEHVETDEGNDEQAAPSATVRFQLDLL